MGKARDTNEIYYPSFLANESLLRNKMEFFVHRKSFLFIFSRPWDPVMGISQAYLLNYNICLYSDMNVKYIYKSLSS